MAPKITGKYISVHYYESDTPGGGFPIRNEANEVDLSTEKSLSYFVFTHQDGVVKVTSHFCKGQYIVRKVFVLDKEVDEQVGNVLWKVYAIIKPNNTLKVTRKAEIDGRWDVRVTQYRFSEYSVVVTTTRQDTDETIVAYKFRRMSEEEAEAANVPDND